MGCIISFSLFAALMMNFVIQNKISKFLAYLRFDAIVEECNCPVPLIQFCMRQNFVQIFKFEDARCDRIRRERYDHSAPSSTFIV